VGAGDIAVCGSDGARQTAALLDSIGGIVFTAGDHAYSNGTREAFLDCYDPHWGRHRGRTRPSPGNHDYRTPGAAPYFEYFGPSAGPPGRGYYSFMAGTWLVLSLNSNVDAGPGSAQVAWLRDELRTHPAACIAAIWHHPIVSSGRYGANPHMRNVWRTLMEFGADLVVTAHDHIYERFERLDADGYPGGSGIRQFVAGTGGAEPYEIGTIQPGSETRASVWGVLKLTLHSQWYEWAFVPVENTSYRDEGMGTCA
jgi:3',5'-cyclic AMP phosphodiesterase CpdA